MTSSAGSTNVGKNIAGLGTGSINISSDGSLAKIIDYHTSGIAIGNNVTLSSGGSNGICIGLNSQIISSAHDAICIGHGAQNSQSSTCLIGDPSILNIRPNNQSCDLGASNTHFKSIYLRYGGVGSMRLYQQLSTVNVNNTATETSITGGSTSLGTLTLSLANGGGQPTGMALRFLAYFSMGTNAGDTLTFNLSIGGVDKLSSNALSVAGGGFVDCTFLLDSSTTGRAYMSTTDGGGAVTVTGATAIAWNSAVQNVFDITATWSAANAANTLAVDMVSCDALYVR